MRTTLILTAALALASTTAAFAQTAQYDRTGDHMFSFGAQTPAPAAKPVRHARHVENVQPVAQTQWQTNVQYDRTGDHMYSYSPASR